MEWIAHIHLATRLLSDRATLLPLRVQTKDAATAAAGRVTNCARSLLSEHFSSSYRSGQPGHKASSNAMRCAAPCSMLHPCDITQRTTKLKLRGSDNCRHYTNHGSHTCRPTELALARSREEEVGNRRKRVSSERERAGWDGVKAAADHRIAADRRPIRNIRFSRCDCPYLRIDDDEHRGVGILISAGVCSSHRKQREDIRGMFFCEDIFILLEMSAVYERANGAVL